MKSESNMVMASNRFNMNRQRVLCDIGYAPDSKPSSRMEALVNDYIENAHQFISPSFSYVVRDIELVKGTSSILEDSIILESGVIARLLEQCKKVAVFVLTIGNYLEDTAARLAQDGLVLQSAVLDAIGSDAAERLADSVGGQISEVAHNQGFTISRRFSPGYCDWDVSQQKMVFQVMKGDCAGVHLTNGCLMLPRKSISGIIGIGPCDVEDYNPCKTCNKDGCVGRRES
ncbi:vitamin B12 dependent-methionine synthase activation domain-containing protein [Chloroflexota bacterium]